MFQALRFDVEEIREGIRAQKSPMGAKLFAKKYKDAMVVEQLSTKDVENMRLCVREKLGQYPDLQKELLETEDAIIIEDVTARGNKGSSKFWGAMLVGEKWEGANILGNIWMDERKELKERMSKWTKSEDNVD